MVCRNAASILAPRRLNRRVPQVSPLTPGIESRGAPFKPSFGLSGRETPRTLVVAAIQSLKQGVSRRQIGDAEHFRPKRYDDFNVRDHAQKLRSIHRNPMKRGRCERPEHWERSSFRHDSTGSEDCVEIESKSTSRKRERTAGD